MDADQCDVNSEQRESLDQVPELPSSTMMSPLHGGYGNVGIASPIGAAMGASSTVSVSSTQMGSPTQPYSEVNGNDQQYTSTLVETRQARVAKYPVNGKMVSFRRTRSLNAPSPIQQFGPCGRIMKNSAMVMTIQDPASQRLTWYKPPLTVLVIKKVRDASVLPPFIQLVTWLMHEKRMVVCVESSVMDDPMLAKNPVFMPLKDKLMTFHEGIDDLTDKIDFIICLGGDGTLLYASSLFQQSVPPVMAFHLGSLGFLTPFEFENFQDQVLYVLEGHAALTLRSRLRCIIMRKAEDGPNGKSKDAKNNNTTALQQPVVSSVYNYARSHHHHHHNSTSGSNNNASGHVKPPPPNNLLVLNEVVIDRGPSPYLCNIDLYLDGKQITSVQGDGLIVSTPTGSTAYAVAAGASMIHPSVPAIMVTPICPHSLSFRPIVVPAGVELKVMLNKDARNTAWVSFDGRHQQELRHGDSLRVTTSIYPVPSICSQDQIADWFESLAECLHWNMRKKQRQFDDPDLSAYYPPEEIPSSGSSSSSGEAESPLEDPDRQLVGGSAKNRLPEHHEEHEHAEHQTDEVALMNPEPAAQKW